MKTLLTYDFLTTKPYVGKRGVERFDFLVKMLKTLNVNVVVDNIDYQPFEIEAFFDLHNQAYLNQLVTYIKPNTALSSVRDMINNYVGDAELVIGYELSNTTRQCFTTLGIRYLDVWFSPYRFGKDTMFSLFSNVKKIQSVIETGRVSNTQLQKEANSLISYCRSFLSSDIRLLEKSALIIGQLFIDKASQKEGYFVSLLDYVDEITQIAETHTQLYLLKHPLMSDKAFTEVREALEGIKNLQYLQGANVYQLMANPAIETVVAVSSSVVAEASFFGKKMIYLYQPVLTDEYVHVREAFFSGAWWQLLLLQESNVSWHYYYCDNWLRARFDAYYAFADFVPHIAHLSPAKRRYDRYQDLVNLMLALDALHLTERLILWGAGSVARLILPFIIANVDAVVDINLQSSSWEDLPVVDVVQLVDSDTVLVSAFKYVEEVEIALQRAQKSCRVIALDELMDTPQ